jgi:hypothetical protein
MPKLYTYLGVVVMFYSNEHEPVHVHGKSQGRESKAEIVFRGGKLSEIRYVKVRGKCQLNRAELRDFKDLVEVKAYEIRNKWIAFFVDNKPIECENITGRLK